MANEELDVMEAEDAIILDDESREYQIAVDKKIEAWERTIFTVTAKSQDDALQIVLLEDSEGTANPKDIKFESQELLVDTIEYLESDIAREVTKEIIDLDTNETLWENR